jgi:dipeptidyl aminopeptidase/acylaminoacyl peptidase
MASRTILALLTLLCAALTQAQLKGFELSGESWTYTQGDIKLTGVLLKPEGNGPFPAMLISHGRGGSARTMANVIAPELVKKGIVCIAVDYTHGSTGTNQNPGASAENIQRAKTALQIVRSLKYVDKRRVAAFGHSMGGFLTIGLAADPEANLQAAIVSSGGITPTPGYAARDTSVAKHVRVPTLILHGERDKVVPPERSLLLKQILDESGTPNERNVYAGEAHNIIRTQSADMHDRVVAWLKKFGVLKG